MSFIFDASDHARLATLFDGACDAPDICPDPARHGPYAGYKPETREAPNGDTKACLSCSAPWNVAEDCTACHGTGRVPNVDAGKRYLHVALKYTPPAWALTYLARAHFEACRVAEALDVPAEFYPRVADGTLRVLEYPAGAGTAEHTDFDMFTILCWRSTPDDLERDYWPSDAGPGENSPRDDAESLSPGLHIGELGELVGLGPATPHRVPARPYAQKSIVYFAMPDHGARLPWRESECPSVRDVPTVGEWLKERVARSRVKVNT
jgi:isopenicillin N synthase-like dioxygenase